MEMRNESSNRKSKTSRLWLWLGGALVVCAFVAIVLFRGRVERVDEGREERVERVEFGEYKGFDNLELGVPGKADKIVNRFGYALGFSRFFHQPLWVAYRLTAGEANPRTKESRREFYQDPDIPGSANPRDYARSGYDRGHLAPAADMAFTNIAMIESFSMANISPQEPAFNRDVWLRLENAVRDIATREGSIFIVTGPVFADGAKDAKYIANGKIRVPEYFYKVILDETPPEKTIAFIIANKGHKGSLEAFAVTVDDVEEATGLDFFSGLPDEKEEALERTCNYKDWRITR